MIGGGYVSSWFNIELDTTSPNISVYAPNYTLPYIDTDIVVSSNEHLDEYQDIYIIDSAGQRHDVIFLYDGYQYIGKLTMNDYPIGVCTVYARLRDDVDNLSNTAMKTINILLSAIYYMDLSDTCMDVDNNSTVRHIDVDELVMDIGNEIVVMGIHNTESVAILDVDDIREV